MENFDFIDEFKNWIKEGEITDAPDIYIEASTLMILSMTIRRNIHIYFGSKKLFTNLWVVLIGRSSLLRKSTCMDLVKQFIDQDLIIAQEITPEKLVETLSFRGQGIFFWDEIMTVLKSFSREYMASCKPMLTELFDRTTDYKRETMGYFRTVKEPFINIMAGTTPEWYQKGLSEADIKSGFIPRFLQVFAFKKDKFIKIPGTGDITKREQLKEYLKEIKDIRYEITLSDEAKDEFGKYSELIEKEILRDGNGLSPFLARLLNYTLKFSILYHISNSNHNREPYIYLDDMKKAVEFSEIIRKSTEKILSKLAFTPYQINRQKVLEILEIKEGKINYSELMSRLKVSKNELRGVLDSLMLENKIIIESEQGINDKKAHQVVRLLNAEEV
ncbi:MAG TPA: DUF3987 domain-containing protein [Candidatus Ratteibacteria bacterium]|nr:DUF3987 domain-containing protein [Candidatus Ratteibacteria bacterium]